MNKPLFLLPFIFVYRMVSFIFKYIFLLIRYTSLGFFAINITIITIVVNIVYVFFNYLLTGFIFISYLIYYLIKNFGKIFKYIYLGFILIFEYLFKILLEILKYINLGFIYFSYIIFKFLKYVIYGLVYPFILIYYILGLIINKIRILSDKNKDKKEKNRVKKENLLKQKEEEKNRLAELKKKRQIEILAEKERRKEEEAIKKQKLLEDKRKRKAEEEYLNEKVKFEKKNFSTVINEFFEKLIKSPETIKKTFNKWYSNLTFVKNAKNKLDINRQALLINFDSEDAVKSDVKILYEYVAKNPEGKVIKDYFEAFSKVEVHSYLLSEGYEVYSIRTNKWMSLLYGSSSSNTTKIKTKDLIFFLTQLSTYIKAGIPLVEALKILTRQYNKSSYKRIFKAIIYNLTMGENFSVALEKQGMAFPRLLINMVKAAEMTGELPEVLDDMADYFTEIEKTRKQMVTTLIYPSIVFIMSIAVVTFIMIFVIPKFVEIYQNMEADQIPYFTKMVISSSIYLEKYMVWIFLGFALVVLILNYLYKNVKIIRTLMQWFMMKVPGFGTIIIYNEVTIFTKTFSSLLSHNVLLIDSMEVLNKITSNEIYKMLILDTISNLARGDKISDSFRGHWAFPIPAYEMIVTGEKTGQLHEMMAKVSDYYQELHKNAVARLKTLVEPALIIFLTFVVGAIILAIILPMFDSFTTVMR